MKDHAVEPKPLEVGTARRFQRVHFRRGQHAGHRRIAARAERGHLEPALGREVEQRVHQVDLRGLRPLDVAGEAHELVAPRSRGHERAHDEGLLVMDAHVAQENEVLGVVKRSRGGPPARLSGGPRGVLPADLLADGGGARRGAGEHRDECCNPIRAHFMSPHAGAAPTRAPSPGPRAVHVARNPPRAAHAPLRAQCGLVRFDE